MNGNGPGGKCPHCGGDPASTQLAQDGSVLALCGGCGASFQMTGAVPGAGAPGSQPQMPAPGGYQQPQMPAPGAPGSQPQLPAPGGYQQPQMPMGGYSPPAGGFAQPPGTPGFTPPPGVPGMAGQAPIMPTPAAKKFGCGRLIMILATTIVPLFIVLPLTLSPRVCSMMSGSHQAALDDLRACPRAQQLLGDNIDAATVGTNCGESSQGGGSGSANWSFTVSGSEGSGSFDFVAFQSGGQWSLSSGTLYVDGQTISIPGDCGAPAVLPTMPVPATPGQVAPVPAVPAPAAGGGNCARMTACCGATAGNPRMTGICTSAAAQSSNPTSGEMVCGQLLTAARSLLGATGGAIPPQCN